MNSNNLKYTDPQSTQTLAEGLEEYYAKSAADVLDPAEMDPDARELFVLHDTAHVVFGCDTSMRDEVLMDTWTLFGSDVGTMAYLKYLSVPEARNVIADAGIGATVTTLVRMVPDVIKTVKRARQMHAKWPWRDHAAYLHRPLVEIRRELGLIAA